MHDQQSKSVTNYPDGVAVIQEFHSLAHTHRQALVARTNTVSSNVTVKQRAPEDFQFNCAYPMSTSLRQTDRSLNEAIIDYTTLQILALRFRDGIVAKKETQPISPTSICVTM